MRVLAIETSSAVLGVAILDEDGRQAEFNYSFELRHTSHLIPTVNNLLKFSGRGLEDMDAYCISIGPGSFTGLRIGVSTIKALAATTGKKVAAVPSLDVLARNIPYTDDTICVVVDAKKEKLYACFYEYKKAGLRKISPYLLIGYDDLLKRLGKIKTGTLLVGDGTEKVTSQCGAKRSLPEGGRSQVPSKKLKTTNSEFWYPSAINTARIGLDMLKDGKVVKDVDALVPVYLHPRDVQCKK